MPITRLMYDFVGSSGYQNTTMSLRAILSIRYTYLLTKMRSWSTSSGNMLVPSTLTGWYKNTTIRTAVPIAKKTSRAQLRISPTTLDSDRLSAALLETGSTSGSIVDIGKR